MEEESIFQSLEPIRYNRPEAWEKMVPEVILFFRIEEERRRAIDLEAKRCNLRPGDFKVLFHLRICGFGAPSPPLHSTKALDSPQGDRPRSCTD